MIRVVLAVILFFPGMACSASFNCDTASSPLDKLICSNEQLSRLDEQMSDYYLKLKKNLDADQKADLLTAQKAWLRQRTRQCASLAPDCLIEVYKSRILELRTASENLIPYTAVSLRDLQGIKGACRFEQEFPEDMRIYSGGAYSGKTLSRQIDQSGHEATQFEVIVNSPDKPVALILGAYEPSIWNIVWTRGTQIVAVIATGYHRQVVAGLPNGIPVLISSHDNQGPCGYLYISQKNLKKVNPFSQKIFGRDVTMVHFASKGKLVFGEQLTREDSLYTSGDNPPDSFFDKSMPLAGQIGLDDLVKKGSLRKATIADAERWAKRKAAENKDGLPPVASGNLWTSYKPHIHNGYVILQKITIPAGLYGGNSATFFLEKGVSYPEGKPGHSLIYDFNTMLCNGSGCPRN